jgi:hypothetical protein
MKINQLSDASAVAVNFLLNLPQRLNVTWIAALADASVLVQVEIIEFRQQREIHLDSRDFIVLNPKFLQLPVGLEEIAWNGPDLVSTRCEFLQFWQVPEQLWWQHLDVVDREPQLLKVYQVIERILRQVLDKVIAQAELCELRHACQLTSFDILEATVSDPELFEFWKLFCDEREVRDEGH